MYDSFFSQLFQKSIMIKGRKRGRGRERGWLFCWCVPLGCVACSMKRNTILIFHISNLKCKKNCNKFHSLGNNSKRDEYICCSGEKRRIPPTTIYHPSRCSEKKSVWSTRVNIITYVSGLVDMAEWSLIFVFQKKKSLVYYDSMVELIRKNFMADSFFIQVYVTTRGNLGQSRDGFRAICYNKP